jgi:hypothetical protein
MQCIIGQLYLASSAPSQKILMYVCSSSLGKPYDLCRQVVEEWR